MRAISVRGLPHRGVERHFAAGAQSNLIPMRIRTDIQALRGIAVMLALLDHANLGPLGAGYLGVDIFFVISGYLMTRMVKEDIEAGTFSFSRFYFRRAKRLLPAAYVTFLATALLAPFVLSSAEFNDFLWQLVGAVTFTSNVVLWQQADYFEGASELKPLLHVWSLSIEEQYYLLLPASLVLLPRRYWRHGAAFVLVASLALCLIGANIKPIATFYLLPTRAWELAVGSVAALWGWDRIEELGRWRGLFWPAVAALFLVPMIPIGGFHPGSDAIAVCVATLVIILCRHATVGQHPVTRALAFVGDASYSLYLAHWPIFAFLNNASVGEPSTTNHAIALALASVLGFGLFRFIELPIRRMDIVPTRRHVGAAVVASLALLASPAAVAAIREPAKDFTQARRVNYGFAEACEYRELFAPKTQCTNSAAPRVFVWGDSFAMHLVPGIVTATRSGVMQATRSQCGPFANLAPTEPRRLKRLWAEQCLAFNQSVMQYLKESESVEVVILASPFTHYLDARPDNQPPRVLKASNGQVIESESSVPVAHAAMRETVQLLKTFGKRVIVFSPPPSSGFDIGLCLDRRRNGKLILGAQSDCEVPRAEYESKRRRTLEFMLLVASDSGAEVVWFDETLCTQRTCATEIDGVFVYRDRGHLSYDGSRLMATRMNWAKLLAAGRQDR